MSVEEWNGFDSVPPRMVRHCPRPQIAGSHFVELLTKTRQEVLERFSAKGHTPLCHESVMGYGHDGRGSNPQTSERTGFPTLVTRFEGIDYSVGCNC